jgi:aminopeptidase N
MVLELTQPSQHFVFTGITAPPVPSLLRDFSAPVNLDFAYTDDELAFLFAHDSDPFNRWEAGQRLATRRLLTLAGAGQGDLAYQVNAQDTLLIGALRKLVNDKTLDPAFRELAISLPSEGMLAEQMAVIDPQSIHTARCALRRQLAQHLRADLLAAYQANHTPGAYRPDPLPAGRRALRNSVLSYLAELNDNTAHKLIQDQLEHASNMTDRVAALAAMVNHHVPGVQQALQQFYDEFTDEPLVIDKWFTLQVAAPVTTVAAVRKLMQHPAFTLKNPNRARSLIFAFCNANPAQFHVADGSGHAFWAEQVIALNAINPQVAARLARTMDRWRKYTPALQLSMQAALKKVAATKKLSKDVAEVINKSLAK